MSWGVAIAAVLSIPAVQNLIDLAVHDLAAAAIPPAPERRQKKEKKAKRRGGGDGRMTVWDAIEMHDAKGGSKVDKLARSIFGVH